MGDCYTDREEAKCTIQANRHCFGAEYGTITCYDPSTDLNGDGQAYAAVKEFQVGVQLDRIMEDQWVSHTCDTDHTWEGCHSIAVALRRRQLKAAKRCSRFYKDMRDVDGNSNDCGGGKKFLKDHNVDAGFKDMDLKTCMQTTRGLGATAREAARGCSDLKREGLCCQ
jgi:hypothetical protein